MNVAQAVQVFAGRAAEAEELGRLPERSVAELVDMGICRMLIPQRWGGQQRDLAEVLELVIGLAHGCMSTAWCAAVWAEHPWVLTHLPPAAQEDVWTAGPDVLISLSNAPAAEVTRTAGGFRLKGSWRFASGSDYAAWFLLHGAWDGSRGLFLLPRADLSIDHDSWRVAGLCGTGSKTVTAHDVFVPDQHVLDMDRRPPPGITRDMPPLYQAPIPAVLGHALAAVAVGGAEAALELFAERAKKRVLHLQGQRQAEDPASQIDLAEATVRVATARLLLMHGCDLARQIGLRGGEASALELAQLRLFKAQVARLCTQAVDRLFAASGGAALQRGEPLQRIWRDVHAVQAHASLTWANQARNFGSLAVGLPATNKPAF